MDQLRLRARQLRKNMTPQEVKLWVRLRAMNADGFHFRRQAPVDGYILDFAEFSRRLIIEVDGGQHNDGVQLLRDQKRDAHFRRAGFEVLRFWNRDIDFEMDGVMDHILAVLRERDR
jgi:very-short-patch-repair endonuclease